MAQTDYSIKDVEKILKYDGKLKKIDVTRFGAPGENYVSLVLRVDFEVEENGHSKIISTVAKRLPFTAREDGLDLHGQAMKNEIKWYSEIVPIFKEFATENDITVDFYPEYYGSRLGLDLSSKNFDKDAVLLLGNLSPDGFQNYDKCIGSDLNTSKAILKALAIFHAIPIAMKIKKPDLFQVVKEYLDKNRSGMSGPGSHKESSGPPGSDGPRGPPGSLGSSSHGGTVGPAGPDGDRKPFGPPLRGNRFAETLIKILESVSKLAPYMSKLKPILNKPFRGPGLSFKLTKEPWNTIVHSDFWVNNVMVNYKKMNLDDPLLPLVKIVDFQLCSYGSYAKDLIFFLLTSVRNDVIEEHMDDLLRFYYDVFTSVLLKTKVDLELNYAEFLQEIRGVVSESEFVHSLIFSITILKEKDPAVEEINLFKLLDDSLKNLQQNQKDKVVLLALESIKRNWI